MKIFKTTTIKIFFNNFLANTLRKSVLKLEKQSLNLYVKNSMMKKYIHTELKLRIFNSFNAKYIKKRAIKRVNNSFNVIFLIFSLNEYIISKSKILIL
jgi:hypothetical protein